MTETTKNILAGLIVGAFLGFAGGVVTARIAQKPCDLTALLRATGEVEQKCEQLAASRCMNVTTPVLNVSVYDMPNLGRK